MPQIDRANSVRKITYNRLKPAQFEEIDGPANLNECIGESRRTRGFQAKAAEFLLKELSLESSQVRLIHHGALDLEITLSFGDFGLLSFATATVIACREI